MRQVALRWVLLVCGQIFVSCGNTPDTTGTKDALYFTSTALPVAYLAEPYNAPVSVAGGAGPYTVRLSTGSLPPGVTLRDQKLSGAPTKLGTYTFTLEVSDANLSSKAQSFTLNVNELPPFALKPQLPAAEIRGETRIPISIVGPRNVRASRLTWELPEGVKVTGVQSQLAARVLYWKQVGRTVTVDMGFTNTPRSESQVALISVKPQTSAKLDAAKFTTEGRDGQGKLINEVPKTEVPKAQAEQTPSTSTSTPKEQADPAAPESLPDTKTPPSGSVETPNTAAETPNEPAEAPSETEDTSTNIPPKIPIPDIEPPSDQGEVLEPPPSLEIPEDSLQLSPQSTSQAAPQEKLS